MDLNPFLNEPIENYLHSLTPNRDKILDEMEQLAAKQDFPIVGPLIGQFLNQMAHITQAKRVFEMGSGFGYSAYWFLKGMPRNGRIILTENSAENVKIADQFLTRAKLKDRVEIKVGNAIDSIEAAPGEFDIIFIDILKRDYPKAYFKALSRLRKGGLLIADNVLWAGTVIHPGNDQDELGIKQFNQLTHTNPDLTTTIIPVRDGLSISVKH